MTGDWITLHRPDGDRILVKIDHITYVAKPPAGIGDARARSQVTFGGVNIYVSDTFDQIIDKLKAKEE